MSASAGGVRIAGLEKSYAATRVLRGVDLEVAPQQVTAVLGASGSGKTTLLRVIAGFEAANAGSVSIDGRIVDGGAVRVRPQHRGVGYVPQDASLFPHLSVAGNIGFGLPRKDRKDLSSLVELVGLAGLEGRLPHQLSGGQQQRVALARALAIKPSVVLLDEPFGALDAALRDTVRSEVAAILEETGTTTILVTHDQDEAMSLAATVAILDGGRVLAHGTPQSLYAEPPSAAVATMIGIANVLAARFQDGVADCVLGRLPVSGSATTSGSTQGHVLVRPEALRLSTTELPDGLCGRVTRVRYHGHDTLVHVVPDAAGDPAPVLDLGLADLVVRRTTEGGLALGQQVWLSVAGPSHAWGSGDAAG